MFLKDATETGTITRLCDEARTAGLKLHQLLATVERAYIRLVLKECKGNQCVAARELGHHRNTLERKMSQLLIVRGEFRIGKKLPAPSRKGRQFERQTG